MLSDSCGWSLLLALPDDILSIVSYSLSPKDVCNLGLCCRSLYALVRSDKVWLSQCEMLDFIPTRELVEWRKGVSCYKVLCRFLVCVKPLIGIWVHQNPELGNVVYVMPGFISVVGCRIIPQELGPLGLQDGSILWAPVFEIIGDPDGSAAFFLHGRESENDYVYPGSLKAVDSSCNVLLLEVEPRQQRNDSKLVHMKSFTHHSNKDLSIKICRSVSGISNSRNVGRQDASMVRFSRLGFRERRGLLEIVTSQIGLKVPNLENRLLFPCFRGNENNIQEDMTHLYKRRSLLMHIYSPDMGHTSLNVDSESPCDPTQLDLNEIRMSFDLRRGICTSGNRDDGQTHCTKKKSLSGYFRDSIKQIFGRSSSANGSHEISRNCTSSSENKHVLLHEFLQSGDSAGLTLHAPSVRLSSYKAWPNMHDNRFALYKLAMRTPVAGHEYAGLWGATFGWPSVNPAEDKLGKALFFLLLSYEESEGQQLLIATKILEGTKYVRHPNGSAMFIVNINVLSPDPFSWDNNGDSLPVNIKHVFPGEGIANGYGFRYPGSEPGSLLVIQDGLLAFIWKESRSVLTLQRLNLQELLKKGKRVPALPPIANFTYLTKSYSNVYASFSNASSSQSSPS